MIDYEDIGFYDLNDDMKIIANDVGMDVARILFQTIPGVTVQIPHEYNLSNSSIRLLQEKCGEDIARRVQENCGGLNITIPKLLPRGVLQRYIEINFNGENAKDLAIDLNIAEKTFYNILGESMKKPKTEDDLDDLFKDLINDNK